MLTPQFSDSDAALFIQGRSEILLTYPEPSNPFYTTLDENDELACWVDLPSALAFVEAKGQMLFATEPGVIYIA